MWSKDLVKKICPRSNSRGNLDSKSAWRLNKECPGMSSLWWIHVKSVIFQSLIDFVHSLLALLSKTDMKRTGIGNMRGFHQGKNQAVIVKECAKALLIARLFAQPEILFKKICCCRDISDAQIEMVQFHE